MVVGGSRRRRPGVAGDDDGAVVLYSLCGALLAIYTCTVLSRSSYAPCTLALLIVLSLVALLVLTVGVLLLFSL